MSKAIYAQAAVMLLQAAIEASDQREADSPLIRNDIQRSRQERIEQNNRMMREKAQQERHDSRQVEMFEKEDR